MKIEVNLILHCHEGRKAKPRDRSLHILKDIYILWYVHQVIVDWTSEFDHWWENLDSKSDHLNKRIATTVLAQMKFLTDLESKPEENMATLRTVAQSKKYRLWRVSHPYEKDIAVRLIVWFPPDDAAVVIVALGANKAPIGDIFYDGVANRADAAIDKWLQETEESE